MRFTFKNKEYRSGELVKEYMLDVHKSTLWRHFQNPEKVQFLESLVPEEDEGETPLPIVAVQRYEKATKALAAEFEKLVSELNLTFTVDQINDILFRKGCVKSRSYVKNRLQSDKRSKKNYPMVYGSFLMLQKAVKCLKEKSLWSI